MNKIETKFKETEIGSIPEKWEVVNIGKALEIIDGDRGINYPNGSDFSSDNFCLFLNAKNVCGDNFDFSNCQYISKIKDGELRKGKMKRGDFVLTTRGTVGNIAFYDESVPFNDMRINSGMVILRNNNDFDSKYLFQLLKSRIIKKQFLELTTGSAQPQLPIRDLQNLKLIKPLINEQKKIAEIFSSLDDKIILNRKINVTLEKMASALFKQWFMDFDFPNKNGKPYKSSGGKMVDSEFGEIPEKWIAGNFGEIINERTERIGAGYKDVIVLSAVNSSELVKSEDYFNKQVYSKSLEKYKSMTLFDFAYNPSRINIGSIGMLENNIKGAVSPVYVVFRPKEYYQYYIQNILRLGFARDYIEQFASGSVRQSLSFKDFASIPIVIPPLSILEEFNKFDVSLKHVRMEKQTENGLIMGIRDSLMPQLLSGKIRLI